VRYEIGNDQIGHWVAERTGEEWHAGKGSTLAFLDDEGQILCGCVFYEYNGRTVWMGVAASGAFSSPEAFHLVADYAFRQLGCEWVRCKIAETNLDSIRLAESVGFELETLLEASHPSGNERIYRMSRGQCRWLDLERSRETWKRPVN
jgi:RimJ/RimL family protein N-acetyltransferase